MPLIVLHYNTTAMNKKEQYQENRKKLIALSQTAKELVKLGEYDRVNDAIIDAIYLKEHPEIKEFKTFGQWKHEGRTIVKGSKAFIIWGQPRKGQEVEQSTEEPQEYKYWPLCYLFADNQVK